MKKITMLLAGILLMGTVAMGATSTGFHKEYESYRGEEVEFTVDTDRMVEARATYDKAEIEEDGYALVDHHVDDNTISTVWYDVEDEEYVVMEIVKIDEKFSTYIYAEGDTLEEIANYVEEKGKKFDQLVKEKLNKDI